MLRLGLRVAVVVGAAVLAAAPVRADVAIQVSPVLIELSGNAGAEGRQDITVRNNGSDAFGVTVSIDPVPNLPADASAVDWLRVEPQQFDLQPGTEAVVTVSIEVPAGITSGGRYANVSFQTGPVSSATDAGGGNRASMSGRLVTSFLIVVNGAGKLVQKAEISRFAPVLEPDGRISFLALLRNAGNVHLQNLEGTITIKDSAGKKIASVDLGPTTPVLPGIERMVGSQVSLPLPAGKEYESTLTLRYGPKQKSKDTAKARFAIRPALTMGPATVCENLDRGPTVRLEFANTGDIALRTALGVRLEAASGSPLGTAALPQPVLTWPGETVPVSFDLPQRLGTGAYHLVMTASYGPMDPITAETDFQIGGTEGTPIPLCTQEG